MKLVRRALRLLRPTAESILRWVIVHRPTRALFNMAYRRFGSRWLAVVYARTAKIFRGRIVRVAPGAWAVPFAGRLVRVPLQADRMWLDWDQAVSIAGHEPDVKSTYRAMLTGEGRPDLFVDVGANYGTHSLLFLVAGVPTITFEPNNSCHDYFREACRLNGVTPDLQPVALGESAGELEIFFPPDQTWLGTSEPELVERLRRAGPLESRRVRVRRLDDYADRFVVGRTLVKLDAEGNELAILRGASSVLQRYRPIVIFESLAESGRAAVADFFDRFGYRLAALPLVGRMRAMSREAFLNSSANDFAAVPSERTPLEEDGRRTVAAHA